MQKEKMIHLDSKVSWVIVLISIGLILLLSGYYCYKYSRDISRSTETALITIPASTSTVSHEATASKPTETAAATPTSTSTISSEIAGMKTYTNKNYGFTFNYPKDIVFEENFTNSNSTTLSVGTDKIADIGFEPSGYGYETAVADEDALRKGDPSTRIGWPVEGSNKLLDINGALAKEFIDLSAFSYDDVHFSRTAIIYHGDDRIKISLNKYNSNDIDKIVQENLSYFMEDKYQTTSDLVWKDNPDGTKKFYDDLVAGKTGPISQSWYKDFDEIISSFRFTN